MRDRKSSRHPLKSLSVVLIACFIALAFSSYFLPDKKPGAYDHIQLEYSLLPPLTRVQFLFLEENPESDVERIIPYDSLFLDSDGIEHYFSKRKKVYSNYHRQQTAQQHSRLFLLGTDRFGRDLFARVAYGSRVSLSIGFLAMMVSLLVGVPLGAIAGYLGGLADRVIMWLASVMWSVPSIMLVMSFTLVFGKSLVQVFVAVGITMWVDVARTVRGKVLTLRNKEYILAAQICGLSSFRILAVHIFPNILGPILILAASHFSTAVLLESGISFLGLGVQPPTPSWGNIIRDHYPYLLMGKPWVVILPAICIVGLILSLISLANRLRDHFDVSSY
ncbi:ABC transporter permease [Schleiferia thermophila]|uniref:ABC transporter permease n=1 Tax=Schleiferia thermophila TaxID=884107 RepID=UPI00068A0C47|nr:ABC transporter permease [Schleiferia thermophila]